MNLLVACHSKVHHSEVVPSVPVERLDYVDPGFSPKEEVGQYQDWSALPRNTYDHVWGIQCPIFVFLTTQIPYNEYPKNDMTDFMFGVHIFQDVWKVLKKGGVFVVPFRNTQFSRYTLDAIQEKAKLFSKTMLQDKWKIQLSDMDSLEMKLDVPEKVYTHVLLFQKPKKGKKPHKTRKRRTPSVHSGTRRV
jgi:hypothetical protein